MEPVRHERRVGDCPQGKPVPGCQLLVVARRPRAPRASLEEGRSAALDEPRRRIPAFRPMEDVGALPVAWAGDVVDPFEGRGGITEGGITDVDSQASWVKRTMFSRAERRIFMADHTKFNVRLLEIVMPLSALTDLVTDKPLPKALAEAAAAADGYGEQPSAVTTEIVPT